MGVNSIAPGVARVRHMGCTCGEPGDIKKKTHPKNVTALFRAQGYQGIPVNMTGLAAQLRKGGYRTHMTGKVSCVPIPLNYPGSRAKQG